MREQNALEFQLQLIVLVQNVRASVGVWVGGKAWVSKHIHHLRNKWKISIEGTVSHS